MRGRESTPGAIALPEAAFLFADIAGFTAYTEIHGDAPAAELAWRLRLGVEGQLGDDAHVVKTLGDAVMARIAEPAEAAAAGLRIVARALPGPGDPDIRVGVHCGPAVERMGDFFGTAVNVAARVCALAAPGEVLVTRAVAEPARRLGLALEDRGERALRNVAAPVRLAAVTADPRDGRGRLRVIPDCRHGVPERELVAGMATNGGDR
jgi:class 3 adenylate cyclase